MTTKALAELRALRASGKKRGSTYEIADARSIYDEVDDEGYKKVVRSRLDQDDFVVEDNGEGYADDGREDWQVDKRQLYGSDSEDDVQAPPRGKAAKRKRVDEEEKRRRTDDGISKYLRTAPEVSALKPKPVTTAEDTAFMADLLDEVNVSRPAQRSALTTVKNEARRKIRVLSPPLSPVTKPRSRQGHGPSIDVENIPHQNCYEGDGFLVQGDDSNEQASSDPVIPSSPVTSAIERKTATIKVEEEEEDDMMEVSEAVGHIGKVEANVNMSGSRPMKKPVKTEYPTPDSSSPTKPPSQPIDPSSWTNIANKLNVVNSSPAADTAPIGKLQPKDAVESDGSLRFFWIDYTELNGNLLLFGKVKNRTDGSFVSCFVKVDNILRKLYFLPRATRQKGGHDTQEDVGMGDVYEEVDALMSKHRVGMHKIKPCSRKYAFELPSIPKEAEYLKLLYPYNKPVLPPELQGETFSTVFGVNTSLFEQFVLWKNIMGPCWLKIEDADFNAVTNASWCKLELQITKPSMISTLGDTDNLDAPPLTMMSIALRTTLNVKENKQEILAISARIYENISLTDTTPADKLPCKSLTIMRPAGDGFPPAFKVDVEKHKGVVKLERNEQGVLSLFLAHLQRVDPDVLMGHRLEDLDYSILLSRLRERKTPGWHRIGRLRRSEWPKNLGRGAGSFFMERQLVCGRLLCDLANDMGKSLMTKCQSWSLAEMCEIVLGKGNVRREIDNETALKTWASTRQGLMQYLQHCETDTYFIAAIALKTQIVPLTKVLTNLAGNSWARTLTGTRAERNEYILLHEFYKNKYICPDKVYGKAKKEEEPVQEGEENLDAKKKDKYKGGLVFEPEKGLYDRIVLVMDFNSLYPSIIQEYNICFTTVDRANLSEDDEKVPEVPEEQGQGILPRLISTLVSRRREVKKLMKDKTATSDQLATWDIKQLALKLTANSMYGCLGYSKSRFYARPLAMLTTFKGREILRSTKELAETRQLQVIYGDTDSVMINTNLDNVQDALKVGNEFKRAVNERYRLLEIDIDNTFRRLLLHAKKKYAAVNMVEVDGKYVDKLEVKGLDMRRREYCALSKETSSNLLNLLLSGEDPELVVSKIHDHLREVAQKMRQFSVPIQKYTIFTQLSKDPKDYPSAKSMPPVQAALRLIARGKPVRAKDVIPFVICGSNAGSQEQAASNAHPSDEVFKADSELKPDVDYYLHKQILPPVERLCAPISLTNVTRLAECLGLDTSKYKVSSASGTGNTAEETMQPLDSQTPDHIRFADCAGLRFTCLKPNCRRSTAYTSLTSTPQHVSNTGLTCSHCASPFANLTLVCQLEHQIRQLLQRYYEAWLVCNDPSCGNRTRTMSVYGHRCLGPNGLGKGCLGRMGWEFGEKALWNQLVYWERAFDVERAKEMARSDRFAVVRVKKEGDGEEEEIVGRERIQVLAECNRERFETLKGCVRGYLDKSGRQWVDMGSLFGLMG